MTLPSFPWAHRPRRTPPDASATFHKRVALDRPIDRHPPNNRPPYRVACSGQMNGISRHVMSHIDRFSGIPTRK